MIIAIINHNDAQTVMQKLREESLFFTKLSTTGGFLKAGNVTVLIGTEDDKVQHTIDIIDKYSKSRKQILPSTSELGMGFYAAAPVEVVVGGATIFVLDVEQFKKV